MSFREFHTFLMDARGQAWLSVLEIDEIMRIISRTRSDEEVDPFRLGPADLLDSCIPSTRSPAAPSGPLNAESQNNYP